MLTLICFVVLMSFNVYQSGFENFEQALFHAKRARVLNDSLFSEGKAKTVQELETKYKTRELEQEKLLVAAEAESNKNKFYISLFLRV